MRSDDTSTDTRSLEERAAEAVERLRAEQPNIRIFQILVPDREDELFLARKAAWSEYKRIIGAVKNEADANEMLVQKFLVYPKPDYEAIQSVWDPGLVVTLAQQIQKGMGFSQGATVKNW